MNVTRIQLYINAEKHPEVIQALERAKQKEGICLYIRQLIEKDIQQQQHINKPVIRNHEISATVEQSEPVKSEPKTEIIDDDFFGGMA